MGIAIGDVCCGHRPAGQSGCRARGLKPGHRNPHHGCGDIRMGHCARSRQTGRNPRTRPANHAVPRAVRTGYRFVLALLLSRSATGPGLARGPARQDERAARHAVCLDADGRKDGCSRHRRRIADHGRRSRDSHELEQPFASLPYTGKCATLPAA
jgi:hypothetical protein